MQGGCEPTVFHFERPVEGVHVAVCHGVGQWRDRDELVAALCVKVGERAREACRAGGARPGAPPERRGRGIGDIFRLAARQSIILHTTTLRNSHC